MEITSEKRTGDILVKVSGWLDMPGAVKLEQELLALTEENGVFVIDLAGVEYISSAGIRALLSLYRELSVSNGSMTVINAVPDVRRILEETDFSALFNLR